MKKFIFILLIPIILGGSVLGISYSVKTNKVGDTNTGSVSSNTDSDVSLSDIANLNKQIDEYAKQVTSLNSYIDELKAKDEDNQAVIDGLEEVVTNKTAKIEELQQQVISLQEQYDKLQADYEELQNTYSSAQLDTDTLLSLYDGSITELVIPEGVTTIRPYAFYGLSLNKLVIPSTVVSIGENAFNSVSCGDVEINAGESINLGSCCFYGMKATNFNVNSTGSIRLGSQSLRYLSTSLVSISCPGTLSCEYSNSVKGNIKVKCGEFCFSGSNGLQCFSDSYSLEIECDICRFLNNDQCSLRSGDKIKVNSEIYFSATINLLCPIYYYGGGVVSCCTVTTYWDVSSLLFFNMGSSVVDVVYIFRDLSSSSVIQLVGNFMYRRAEVFSRRASSSPGFSLVDFIYDDTNSVVEDFSTNQNYIKKIINRSTNFSNNFIVMLSDITEEVYVADEVYDQYLEAEAYTDYIHLFHKISELDTVE